MHLINKKTKFLTTVSAVLLLSACSAAGRLANVGSAPDLAPIKNPAEHGDYQKVAMPMPAMHEVKKEKNSLWGDNNKLSLKINAPAILAIF